MRELVDVHYPDAACICRPTRPAPSMRHSRRPKPGEFCAAWSSTIPPSMPVGSTWSRSRSAYSAASVWIAESTTLSASPAQSPHGNDNETPPAPASNGCSQPTRRAPKWAAHIPLRPKSHKHCAEILARRDWHQSESLLVDVKANVACRRFSSTLGTTSQQHFFEHRR
jgi:hypothetical protein